MYKLKGLLLNQPKPISATMPTYNEKFRDNYLYIFNCRVTKENKYALELSSEFLKSKKQFLI